jgi:putative transposase
VVNVALTGEKKLKGRKRHILVDTMGNLLRIVVQSAGIQDRDGADYVFEAMKDAYPELAKVWAAQGYTGDLGDYVRATYTSDLEIVETSPEHQGFVVLPRRWVVERSLAWLNRYRRLSKDYEHRVDYSETWIYIASIARMLRKLHPNASEEPPYVRKTKQTNQDKISALCV